MHTAAGTDIKEKEYCHLSTKFLPNNIFLPVYMYKFVCSGRNLGKFLPSTDQKN